MDYGPLARILLRYGVGYFAGSGAGAALALDPDLVGVLALVCGAAIEASYAYAKKRGWAT
jgi:hypothetical protein